MARASIRRPAPRLAFSQSPSVARAPRVFTACDHERSVLLGRGWRGRSLQRGRGLRGALSASRGRRRRERCAVDRGCAVPLLSDPAWCQTDADFRGAWPRSCGDRREKPRWGTISNILDVKGGFLPLKCKEECTFEHCQKALQLFLVVHPSLYHTQRELGARQC